MSADYEQMIAENELASELEASLGFVKLERILLAGATLDQALALFPSVGDERED